MWDVGENTAWVLWWWCQEVQSPSSPPKMTFSSFLADQTRQKKNYESSQRRSTQIVSPHSRTDKAPDVIKDICPGGSEVEASGEEAHRRGGSNMIVSQHSVSGVTWPAGGEVQKCLYVAIKMR